MLSSPCAPSDRLADTPTWLPELLGATIPGEGGQLSVRDSVLVMRNGILRADSPLTESQAQTRESFSFIWSGTDRFQNEASAKILADWCKSHYGDVASAPWWNEYGAEPLLVDAGCGAGLSALGLFGERLRKVRYLGVDVSTAVEAAAARFAARGIPAAFLQISLMEIPLPDKSVDVIYSQGVLHHTDSTEQAIHALTAKLKIGGRFLFYVYRRKGPIREFADDYVRAKLQALTPEEAWEAVMPLTKLGKALGDMKVEIEVPEAVELLDLPAGKIDLQRLFYWHIFKAFHNPKMTLDELNHINLDWYAPVNAHRQSPEEVRGWCQDAGLEIEHEHLQESGITIIARRV